MPAKRDFVGAEPRSVNRVNRQHQRHRYIVGVVFAVYDRRGRQERVREFVRNGPLPEPWRVTPRAVDGRSAVPSRGPTAPDLETSQRGQERGVYWRLGAANKLKESQRDGFVRTSALGEEAQHRRDAAAFLAPDVR